MQVIKISNAVKYIPIQVIYNLAINGYIVTDNCVIYQLKNEKHLRLHNVSCNVPQAYEELIAKHGTNFKIFFIIFDGNICKLSMFRICPYIDTIAHTVINKCSRYIP